MNFPGRSASVAICLVGGMMVALGCKAKAIRVDLAPGFSGPVRIGCDAIADDVDLISVNATGTLDGATCPKSGADLMVVRDGKIVPVAGRVEWMTTGDGIPTGIQFTVK